MVLMRLAASPVSERLRVNREGNLLERMHKSGSGSILCCRRKFDGEREFEEMHWYLLANEEKPH